MTTTKAPLFLRVLKNGKLLDVKQFTGQQIVIGREGKVDALINDGSISPIHAMIEEREDGKFYLCDLGSQSGTFYNGEKVVDQEIESGAEFKIGDLNIEFHVGIPKPKKVLEERTAVVMPTATAAPTPTPAPEKEKPVTAAPITPTASVTPKALPKDIPAKETPKETLKEKSKEAPKEMSASSKDNVKKTTPLVTPPGKINNAAGVTAGIASISSVVAPSGGTTSKKYVPPKGTFAPPSSAKLQESLKPGKGNVLEIVLVWKDRILNTYHFDKAGVIQIGSHPQNQIILPSFGSVRISHPLVKIENGATTVFLTQDMGGDVVRDNTTTSIDEMRRKGSIVPSGVGFSYGLQQNEMMKINIGEGVSLIIRFVVNGPESRLIPFIDMTVNQLTGLLVGLMATTLFLFYVFLYAPAPPEAPEPEPERKAIVLMPKQIQIPVKMDTTTEPEPKTAAVTEKTKAPPAPARGKEGGSKNPKPSKTKVEVSKVKGTSDSGAPKAAAQKPLPKPKDVSKSGLLGAFGSAGMQNEISKAHGASQGATSVAESATGKAPDGTADGGGNALHDVQASGTGTATYGIKGVQTAGRGSGKTGYGQSGIGAKKNASLIAGDEPSVVSGTIDKEAIRRVVQANLKQIKACYEKGLNREPGLYGKIVIQWTIGPGGKVLEAGIKTTTMNSADVENCSVARLKTWKFPEPPAGEVAVVSYPFVFQAQE